MHNVYPPSRKINDIHAWLMETQLKFNIGFDYDRSIVVTLYSESDYVLYLLTWG